MPLVSLSFALFFGVAASIYFWIQPSRRPLLLLGVSYFFISTWSRPYAVFLACSTLINYFVGHAIQRRGKLPLAIGIIFNLLMLFIFKYIGDFSHVITRIILPLGISFY